MVRNGCCLQCREVCNGVQARVGGGLEEQGVVVRVQIRFTSLAGLLRASARDAVPTCMEQRAA